MYYKPITTVIFKNHDFNQNIKLNQKHDENKISVIYVQLRILEVFSLYVYLLIYILRK